jgi:hypothetical protein
MNIDYLDVIFSACFTLRKLKKVVIEQEKGTFLLRPQLHVMVVSPFGTFKSSITKRLKKQHALDIYCIDNFTRAGMEGTISKDGEYVPSLIKSLGGKALIIDEWNSVDYYGQRALLGILENQSFSRVLGFKVKKNYFHKDKFGSFSIRENCITGNKQFCCIAYAMDYPYSDNQADKALLSRFTPLFIEPTIDYMKENTIGNFELNIYDHSGDVDEIVVTKECYLAFHQRYYDYIDSYKLVPDNTDDYGFLSRVMSDVLRLGIFIYLGKNKPDAEIVKIDCPDCFFEAFKYINTLLQQFKHPKTSGKLEQYKELLRKYPGKNKEFYYTTLGISRQTLYHYDLMLNRKFEAGEEFLEAEP